MHFLKGKTEKRLLQMNQKSLLEVYPTWPFSKKQRFSRQVASIEKKWEGMPVNTKKLPVDSLGSSAILKSKSYNNTKIAFEKRSLVVLFAGGLASRFHSKTPKILFPVYKRKTPIDFIAEKIASYSTSIPLWIMTSKELYLQVLTYIKKYPIPLKEVQVFPQESYPFFDQNSQWVVDRYGKILEVPNGNGDIFYALKKAPFFSVARYSSIDFFHFVNSELFLSDPVSLPLMEFLDKKEADLVFQVFTREKKASHLGMVQMKNNKTRIYEYSEYDLPDSYKYANIGHYCMSKQAFFKIMKQPPSLPYHWVSKTHNDIVGYKAERFFFDIFSSFSKVFPLAFPKEEAYLPFKSKKDLMFLKRHLKNKS